MNISSLYNIYNNIIVDNNILYEKKLLSYTKKPYLNNEIKDSCISLSSKEINIDLPLLSDLLENNEAVSISFPMGHYSIYWKNNNEILSIHSALGWPLSEKEENYMNYLDTIKRYRRDCFNVIIDI
jgi:hypothetical protein